ncbi:hypothetical protein AB833_01290 [Chromatiales bacterium (ex Bugula neritina AB1)]|nr:hypothetical protein AB833_01290 [Chromatiales bacterium (ex Bugula neritina AB1)]
MSPLQKTILNGVMFNITWLVCVLGGNAVAIVATTILIVFHLTAISRDKREFFLITGVALFGVMVESGLLAFSVLQSPESSLLPPPWLVALWAAFATTLNHSIRWFQNNFTIAYVVGAIAGPLSYLTGTRLTS